jgi:Enolase C-terminal domain-like
MVGIKCAGCPVVLTQCRIPCQTAICVIADAAELDIRWLDDPVSSDNLAGLREVRDRVDAHVAAGEYGTDLHYRGRRALRRWRDLARPDFPVVQSVTHGYAGTHEEACGAVGRHLVGDRCGGSGPTRLLWLVGAELRRGGDGRRHGRGRTPELSGGQPQGQVPIAAALELSRTQLG